MKKTLITQDITFFLFLIFPVSILLGNFAINLNILIISLICIFDLIRKKIRGIHKDRGILLLVFFFISLLINLMFSNDISLSYLRVIKVFFIIFFIFSFKHLLINFSKKYIEKIYIGWSIIFAFIVIDLIIEYIRGENIIGFKSIMPGERLASFTGTESVIGNYFYGFVLIFLSCVHKNFIKKNYLNVIIAIFLVTISLIIGERANFIRSFLLIALFIFFINDFDLKSKIFSLVLIIILIITFVNFNEKYKTRYYNQISTIFNINGLSLYLANSQYGAHYKVAYEIFKDNPFFGIGVKNFRVESANNKYSNLDHQLKHHRIATHPHQIHYEFLSETGTFGYLSFVVFIFLSLYWSIKNYLINKNIYQLSSIFFVITSLLPFLPSGSFLSTFTSSIFWLNYSIMIGYNNIKN